LSILSRDVGGEKAVSEERLHTVPHSFEVVEVHHVQAELEIADAAVHGVSELLTIVDEILAVAAIDALGAINSRVATDGV
jgi:hypothetical protein